MEGDLQRRLGENLRSLRRARGLSQEALADALGIHRTYVGGLERGERNVTLRTVERLAELLGVDAARLLAGDDRPPGARSGPRAPARRVAAGSARRR